MCGVFGQPRSDCHHGDAGLLRARDLENLTRVADVAGAVERQRHAGDDHLGPRRPAGPGRAVEPLWYWPRCICRNLSKAWSPRGLPRGGPARHRRDRHRRRGRSRRRRGRHWQNRHWLMTSWGGVALPVAGWTCACTTLMQPATAMASRPKPAVMTRRRDGLEDTSGGYRGSTRGDRSNDASEPGDP